MPYTHFFYVGSTPNDFMTYTPYLIYPPLYLYIISMFGNNPYWVVALPILILDLCTTFFIYKIIVKVWKNNYIALIASLIYQFNPLTLYYGEYCWLNPSIFTFFLVISIYFLLDDRFYLSIVFLSLSIMCKQFSGIFLTIILIRLSRRMQDKGLSVFTQFKKYIKVLIAFILPIFLLSIPYILPTYPDFPDYLYHIFAVGGMEFNLSLPEYSVPVDFVIPFIKFQFEEPILIGLKYLLEYYIILIISIVIICCGYSFFVKRDEYYNRYTLIYTLILLISMTLFFPRGFYKYYTILFVPLMSIFIMKNLKNKGWTNWKNNATEIIVDLISVGIYFGFSFLILLINRYLTPFVLLAMIFYYSFYAYVDFNSLLKKFFRIYSRKIYNKYEKHREEFDL
ncbi:MAG: hypothetical protein ACTSRP_25105 [Candidatus Helarchaeota archaeon]